MLSSLSVQALPFHLPDLESGVFAQLAKVLNGSHTAAGLVQHQVPRYLFPAPSPQPEFHGGQHGHLCQSQIPDIQR